MAKSRENIALEWTQAELVEMLAAARRALETYAEALDNGARVSAADLAACVDGLHQTHGVLVMLELESAASFAAHLEAVAAALAAGRVADPMGAAECLMQGLLELPDYLEAQRSGLGDTIVPLLSLLNELRVHLGQPPLAAPGIRHPLAVAPDPQVLERFAAIDGPEKARRLRAVYQQVLLAVLKGGVALGAVETLQKVAVSLQRLCEGAPQGVLWQVFGEYLKALHAGLGRQPGPLAADAVKLLRRMDAELRTVGQAGTDALATPVSIELTLQLINATRARGGESPFLDELEQSLTVSEMSEALANSGRAPRRPRRRARSGRFPAARRARRRR